MNLTKIAGIITALAVIIGTAWSLDSRWAYRKDFAELGTTNCSHHVCPLLNSTESPGWKEAVTGTVVVGI